MQSHLRSKKLLQSAICNLHCDLTAFIAFGTGRIPPGQSKLLELVSLVFDAVNADYRHR